MNLKAIRDNLSLVLTLLGVVLIAYVVYTRDGAMKDVAKLKLTNEVLQTSVNDLKTAVTTQNDAVRKLVEETQKLQGEVSETRRQALNIPSLVAARIPKVPAPQGCSASIDWTVDRVNDLNEVWKSK